MGLTQQDISRIMGSEIVGKVATPHHGQIASHGLASEFLKRRKPLELDKRAVPTNEAAVEGLGLSRSERALMEEYTIKTPVVVDGEPDAHFVWLIVGAQQFCIKDHSETAAEADWTRAMLGKALERLINDYGMSKCAATPKQ